MKIKQTLTALFLVLTTALFSQTETKWSTLGIAASAGDFLGTTNAYPIDFKTNNIFRASLSTTGIFKINNLAGTGSRLLQTDSSGNIIFLSSGSPTQVLFGDGTWGAIPTPTTSSPWSQSGTNVYTTNNVGIGTSFPLFPLDVYGDMRVSNNLYVGGGIVISQKMQATSSLKTDTVHSVTGETNFTSKVILKNQFQVDGSSLFNGTLQATNISTTGYLNAVNSTVSGVLATNKLILGSAIDNINIISESTGTAKFIHIGFPVGPSLPPVTTCIKPYVGSLTNISTRALITNTGFSNVLDFNNDGLNGYIDYGYDISLYANPLDGTAPTPIPALKINSACYGDVEIAKGGGYVSTGRHFEVGNPVRNGGITSNINGTNGLIGQRVTVKANYPIGFPSPPAQYNSQLFVDRFTTKALAVFNTETNLSGDETFAVYGDGKAQINALTKTNKYFVVNDASIPGSSNESFVVYGNGKTEIRINNPTATPNAFDVVDVLNNKINFRVKANGFVYAREVEILNTAISFPDYVFSKDYKLPTLPELEAYIAKNKHLPSFENAEYYETNGIKSSEMFVKQQEKIEELTLYIIELEKRMKALEQIIKKIEL